MDVDEFDETVNDVGNVEYVYLMRYLMMMRLVEKKELINTYKIIFENDARVERLQETIEAVNGLLRNARLEVKEVNCEVKMSPYYVVYSTLYRPDKIWPSNRADDELEFIKLVVHEIMVSGRGVISSIHCLNLDAKLSKSDRDRLLKTLVAEKWLIETKKGSFTLSALCMAELEPYLRENYRDILTKCTFCKRNVCYGDMCSKCNVLGHRLCVKKYQQSMKKAFKCPACGEKWVQSQSTSQMEDMECDESD